MKNSILSTLRKSFDSKTLLARVKGQSDWKPAPSVIERGTLTAKGGKYYSFQSKADGTFLIVGQFHTVELKINEVAA